MRLNAAMVFDQLPATLHATMAGRAEPVRRLHRPKLYETGTPFQRNHLYVVDAATLRRRIPCEPGVVLVSIGEPELRRWYEERCCVIRVDAAADFCCTFNAVQRIFDAFDAWDATLDELLRQGASIQELLDASAGRFRGNALLVTDADFDFLGLCGEVPTVREAAPTEEGLSVSQVGWFLNEHDLSSMEATGPLLLETQGGVTLSVNLIEQGVYLGCLTVMYTETGHWGGDDGTAEHLAGLIADGLRQLSLMPSERDQLARQAVEGLIAGRPLGTHERDELRRASEGRSWACLRLGIGEGLQRMPAAFLCDELARTFPGALAFPHGTTTIVAVVPVEEDGLDGLCGTLQQFGDRLRSGRWHVGVSDEFDTLLEVVAYFREATVAVDRGSADRPREQVHRFQDFALGEMLSLATAELAPELYGTPGLRALIEHDRDAAVSYVDTLSCYLEHDRSASETARALYVHRSTLLDRLARIQRILGDNLDDPDVRLRLRMVLRAIKSAT